MIRFLDARTLAGLTVKQRKDLRDPVLTNDTFVIGHDLDDASIWHAAVDVNATRVLFLPDALDFLLDHADENIVGVQDTLAYLTSGLCDLCHDTHVPIDTLTEVYSGDMELQACICCVRSLVTL